MRGMSSTGNYYEASVRKFSAHLLRKGSELVVIFTDYAEHGHLEFSERIVNLGLGGRVRREKCIREPYGIISEALFPDLFPK
jgi:hypothetical protein